jgi:hypothetical protein
MSASTENITLASSSRAWAGVRAPATWQARNVSSDVNPLEGWFSSSQSRNCPLPPRPTVPVPVPPTGREMHARSFPRYRRATGHPELVPINSVSIAVGL